MMLSVFEIITSVIDEWVWNGTDRAKATYLEEDRLRCWFMYHNLISTVVGMTSSFGGGRSASNRLCHVIALCSCRCALLSLGKIVHIFLCWSEVWGNYRRGFHLVPGVILNFTERIGAVRYEVENYCNKRFQKFLSWGLFSSSFSVTKTFLIHFWFPLTSIYVIGLDR
jgi:hypothetical protein